MEQWLYRFEELGMEFNDLVGKKCANLGEMSKLGMRVPYGFAISVQGFEAFMNLTGLAGQIRERIEPRREILKKVEVCQEESRVVQHLIESMAMPESMRKEIVDYYRELCTKLGRADLPVAVRSSGIVSMPGQMDTYLNISGEDNVIEYIKKVWSSAYTVRAMMYRIEKNLPVEWAPIGVAVMMLVDAKAAGVILTVLPTTGDTTQVIIEGNWGLGESVVSGEITPDSFTLEKENMQITGRHVCRKQGMVVREASGTVYSKVPEELQEKPCLDDDELLALAEIALAVEKHFGMPQDMEWVIDKNLPFPENIFWVQARPAKFTKADKSKDVDYIINLMVGMFD
ncbi:MAG: PEP/pyruvate-binding domain-containing protein [Syntrophales bacterium]|jgi:pyruvate,water dikinase|nr:PEP/pyruvate-binding domain-containing protein [Syntrophales bacterium]